MEPFKEKLNAEAVRTLADEVAAVSSTFAAAHFVHQATDGLADLELKARVRHIALALRRQLPDDFEDALDVLVAALRPPNTTTENLVEAFHYWPVLQVVEEHGVQTPEASLAALREMTRRFSAEFAVRPLIEAHPELAWATIEGWVEDADVHVRRLASEGTRPRLPWGRVLRPSVDDPRRGLELISRLVDDPERYVRLSVSNHLNDVAKDHPSLAVARAGQWMERPSKERERAARHGLRTLFRKGDAATLALFGFGPPEVEVAGPSLTPPTVLFGDAVTLDVGLTHLGAEPAALRVEWVFTYPRGRKVFRGPERTLSPGETWSIRKAFPMRPVTTRKTRPGLHRVAVQVNGVLVGDASFELVGGDA
ncbi:MAG: DNA alkylation repair protein [Proteobacteria bacterium]|nr:DNA alkylation repair protein [Pseudomonadota bacterium]